MLGELHRILFPAALLMAGCARYAAKPLTPDAVQNGLAVPARNQLTVLAKSIQHPILKPVVFDENGLTPDQAAIMAVLINPSLRANRDQRGLASAQVLQAGILPNPQISAGEDFPFGGDDLGAANAWNVGVSWDVAELISRGAHIGAAKANAASVDLDIAWQEWQTAQAARTAVYDQVALQGQLDLAGEIDRELQQNLTVVRNAVERHDKTLLDLSAAESASLDAHSAVLSAQRDLEDARLALNKALGVSPDAQVKLNPNIDLPEDLPVPAPQKIIAGLEERRLDLVALKLGYQSQEQTLRAAVLEQFPKVNIGFVRQRDDTNIQLAGFAVTFDLPVFDRNQAAIAMETATRQKLFDEYIQRVSEANFDVYTAVGDLNAITHQIAAEEQSLIGLRQLTDAYRDALGHGNVDVLSYYTALGDLAQKQLDVLKLKQQLMDNFIALELAAGEYLPDQSG
jgi:outer membrane protein, heavy metal efflux system